MPASSRPQSSSVRAIGPAWSRLGASGTMPRSETRPRVGLIVEVPERAEGMRSEPAVSVPVAAGTMRAASAAAEPPLEPPAERSSAHGLPTWSVVPPAANSCVCRWPSRIMPCGAQPRPDVAVAGRQLVQQRARRRQRLARDRVEILQADRDAPQRGGAPGLRARARELLVGARGGRQRVLLVDPHPGVDRGGIALVAVRPVALADAFEAGFDELGGREPAVRDQRGGLDDAQVGGMHVRLGERPLEGGGEREHERVLARRPGDLQADGQAVLRSCRRAARARVGR